VLYSKPMSERLDDVKIKGWESYQIFVLNEMGRLSRAVEDVNRTVTGDLAAMKIEIATLKTKWAIYAAIIGTIAGAIISAAVSYLIKR
jgi:hypothetical protein